MTTFKDSKGSSPNSLESRNSKTNDDETQEYEWDFNIEEPKSSDSKSKLIKDPDKKTNDEDTKSIVQLKKSHLVAKKEHNLVLDRSSVPKAKTRSAMAFELRGNKENHSQDSFIIASLPKRAIAFGLDTIFMFSLLYTIKLSSVFVRELMQNFLDDYKLHLVISEWLTMNILRGGIGLVVLFFFIVLPVAFFNISFGKKIIGLRIRGTENYRLSISQAFNRELIFKPLGIIIIAGFITPFISKKEQSIHDMLTNTIVIEL